MTERDEDREGLEQSRKALADAKSANEETDKVLEELHRTSVGIRIVVERNGYVDRFREMIRGA